MTDRAGRRTLVFVEGVTDQLALILAAGRWGRDLEAEGVAVVPINGAHAIGRHLRRAALEHPGAGVAGLYDKGEEEVIRRALERAGHGPNLEPERLEAIGFFACVADLEEELIRALGPENLGTLIEREGDAQPWRTFQSQRDWKGRPLDQQFRRFIRSVSERNARYVRALVETIDPRDLPRPLRLLLAHVEPVRRGGQV